MDIHVSMLNGFFGMDITMDIAWILKPGCTFLICCRDENDTYIAFRVFQSLQDLYLKFNDCEKSPRIL